MKKTKVEMVKSWRQLCLAIQEFLFLLLGSYVVSAKHKLQNRNAAQFAVFANAIYMAFAPVMRKGSHFAPNVCVASLELALASLSLELLSHVTFSPFTLFSLLAFRRCR